MDLEHFLHLMIHQNEKRKIAKQMRSMLYREKVEVR
jgi:hypothetical protein